MLETLDVIIATAAVILGLSLIVQAMQQILKQFFDLKSSYMRTELLALFSGPSTPKPQLTNWKSFTALAKDADEFAQRIVKELEGRLNTFGFTDLHLIEDVDNAKFKEILKSLPVALDTAVKSKFDDAIAEVDRWFDFSKRAFQEHYQRRMKPWAVAISAVVVIGLNANLLDIYREFSHNKSLRDVAVTMGERYPAVPREQFTTTEREGKLDTVHVQEKTDAEIVREMRARIDSIKTILDDQGFQILRWNNARQPELSALGLLHAVVGWMGMVLLVSLGAPFWYDFLKAVTGLKDKLKSSSKQN